MLNFTLVLCENILPAEIWALILSYLNHVDLLNISACSKLFYYLLHKNEKFIQRLNHSKLIVSNTNIFDKYKDAWCSFVHKLSYKLKKYCDEDTMLIIKKKILSDIIFETLPFRVYNHLFNCNIGFYIYKKCIFCTRFHVRERALSDFLNQKLVLLLHVFLYVHYHGIIYSSRDRNFENNCCNFRALYYECINSVFTLYKFYLEVLCRIIFNNVTKKISPKLLSDLMLIIYMTVDKGLFVTKSFIL